MAAWMLKWIVMAVLLYGTSFLFGERVKFRGFVPALTVALLITPVCIFAPEINSLLSAVFNYPMNGEAWVFAGACIYTALALAVSEKAVPDVRIENFMTGLAFSVAVGGLSLVLFLLTNEQSLLHINLL